MATIGWRSTSSQSSRTSTNGGRISFLFVNGLALGVIELKNPTDENATIRSAFQQLQTYKAEISSLFAFNAALIVSDGLDARIGTLTASWEWFKPWRTITG